MTWKSTESAPDFPVLILPLAHELDAAKANY